MIKTTNAELNRIRNYAKNEKEPYFILGVMILEELLEIQRLLRQSNADKVGQDRDRKRDPKRQEVAGAALVENRSLQIK